jgi:hypothetical protein
MSIVNIVARGGVDRERNEDRPKSLLRAVVLCVDDDHKQLAMRVSVLSVAGYSVISTTSSSEAQEFPYAQALRPLAASFYPSNYGNPASGMAVAISESVRGRRQGGR